MADPFVAEIRLFPFNFAPKGWAYCNGQLMPISQNTALFALLGTTYGGDGKSTFALPNLQGKAPMHPGQGPGLSIYDLGQEGGTASVTLLPSEIPSHSHALLASTEEGSYRVPNPQRVPAVASNGERYGPPADLVAMAPESLASVGGGLPHNNLMPSLVLSFCIALQGVFPPRH